MSEPVVDAAAVRHVAELARIELTDEEIDQYRAEFADILDYFDRLDAVPAVPAEERDEHVLRQDDVRPSLPPEEALRNAEETEDGYFKGPRVS